MTQKNSQPISERLQSEYRNHMLHVKQQGSKSPGPDLASLVRQKIGEDREGVAISRAGANQLFKPFIAVVAIAASLLLFAIIAFPTGKGGPQSAQHDDVQRPVVSPQNPSADGSGLGMQTINAGIAKTMRSVNSPHDAVRALVANLSGSQPPTDLRACRNDTTPAQQDAHLIAGLASRILGKSLAQN